MARCSFCAQDISEGTGKMIIQKTGKIHNFCSSKCERSLLKLGRDPRNLKWTGKREKQMEKVTKIEEAKPAK